MSHHRLLPARCVVCGDEFEVCVNCLTHEQIHLDEIRLVTWIGERGVMAWPSEPVVLAVSCGPLVHPLDVLTAAVRLHGGEEAFWLFTVDEGAA